MSNYDARALYDLVPEMYRNQDAGLGYPLRDLIEILAKQASIVERDIARLYGNQFIETCEPWAVPYFGDLIGVRSLPPLGTSGRAEVANMIGYRRRKGTAAVLEALSRDVTGLPTRVVEFFDLLPTKQYMEHLRMFRPSTVNLRDANALDLLNGPFEDTGHLVDVRRVATRQGKYNIPNVGLFIFRISAYPLNLTQPEPLGDPAVARYSFNTLGIEVPLFHHQLTETGLAHVAGEENVPVPIRPRALHEDLEAARDVYYGASRSIGIFVPTATGWELAGGLDIRACNLDNLTRALPAGVVGIDPARGLLAFQDPSQRPDNFRVSSYYGFSSAIGGGQYDRELDPEVAPTGVVGDAADPIVAQIASSLPAGVNLFDNLGDALIDAQAAWVSGENRLIEILDSRTYRESPSAVAIPDESRLVIRAANRHRPTVILSADLAISGSDGSSLELDGLLISGGQLTVSGQLNRLHVSHCTLVPGRSLNPDGTPVTPDAVSLVIDSDSTEATIRSAILGGVMSAPEAEVAVTDSILDVHEFSSLAYGGAGGAPYGGPLTIARCTVIGSVNTTEFTLGENSIFMGPAVAERRQSGCVRYSWIPNGSRVPRRFHCQPLVSDDASATEARNIELAAAPRLSSLTYPEPDYCQLDWRGPEVISRGGEDESEMGVFFNLKHPQRAAGLAIRLDEFLPVGLEAGIFFAS